MNRRTLRRWAQAATLASAALILYATLAPSPPDPAGIPDWLAHLALFACIGASAALWYATSDEARRSPRRALLVVLLALWLFGGLTEVAQGATTTRDPSISDLAFDVAGAVGGFIVGGVLWRAVLGRVAR